MVLLGQHLVRGFFERKHNRFIVGVRIRGRKDVAFLPNTARLGGILVGGAKLYLRKANRRRVPYDVIIAYDGNTPVVVDSRIPNEVVNEALLNRRLPQFTPFEELHREVTIGGSRLDFVLKDLASTFLEVKGCTMAKDGIAFYPDAPTERGRRHLELLSDLHFKGHRVGVIFLAMRSDVRRFKVNLEIDPKFAVALKRALAGGVEAYSYSTRVENNFNCVMASPLKLMLN